MSHAIQKKLASLTPAQRALLEKKLAARRSLAQAENTIPKRDTTGPAPLSYAQERLWVFEQFEEDNAIYGGPRCMRLLGPLNVTALCQTLNALVERHESLRTVFPSKGGQPEQVVLPTEDLDVQVEMWEGDLKKHLCHLMETPFDLEKGPLFRVNLFQVSEQEHVLFLNFHHVISDEWSNNIFISEMNRLYAAFERGETLELPALPINYQDFAAWQRSWLNSDKARKMKSWWQEHLEDTPHLLELPLDHTRGARQSFRGGVLYFDLDERLQQCLPALLQQAEVTPFMFFLAVWEILLYRFSGQTDFCVGTPVSGRNHKELEGLIGCFLNMLPLKAECAGEPDFQDFLKRVRTNSVAELAAADLPMEALLETLKVERQASITPLFQTVFSFHNTKHQHTDLKGLQIKGIELEREVAKFDIALHVMQEGDRFRAALEYNADLFEAHTMDVISEAYRTLCLQVTQHQARSISQLELLTESSRENLIGDLADGGEAVEVDQLIHEAIALIGDQDPTRPAIIETETLTFGELNLRASQLANHLVEQGAAHGMTIGVCLERSTDLIVSLLAIMKTGAAYVPMDPAYPADRLSHILEDAGIFLLVTKEDLLERVSNGFFGLPICLDSDGDLIEGQPVETTFAKVDPLQTAYMIYTSASTGKAKGVRVSHRALSNLIGWHQATYQLDENHRAALIAGVGFDASVWEIWPTLSAGAALCIPDENIRRSTELLVGYFDEHQVTVSFLPTPLAEVFIREKQQPQSLRFLLTGGDKLQGYPGALPYQLINHYGPTENAVVATAGVVPAQGDLAAPHIGRPILGVTSFILDKHLNPVPRGSRGELCIGGFSLADGYHEQAALTAERFIPNTFGKSPGERLYRSGDLVRYTTDDNIEFLGRADNQIKLRGFRIEPDEIEAALITHPQVLKAVVMLVDEPQTGKCLVGWVQPCDDQQPAQDVLRSWISGSLPEYMVPAHLVILEKLPTNANGKVDRRALPMPDVTRVNKKNFQTPRNGVEATLVGIWQDVLGRDKVSVHDNFFEIGGDSILSIQIVARANAAGLRLQSRHMFDYQTIAELAPHSGNVTTQAKGTEVSEAAFALSPIQEWFFAQQMLAPNDYVQSMLFSITQPVTVDRLQEALNTLVASHDGLRTAFDESARTQSYVAVGTPAILSVIDLHGLTGQTRDRQLSQELEQLHGQMNLANGSVFAAALIQGDGPDLLYLTAHHLVVDGVSWRIITDDLTMLLSRGDKLGLPAKTTSFQYWSQNLKELTLESSFETAASYWQSLLAQPRAGLPAWFTDENGHDELTLTLNERLTEQLLQAPAKAFGMKADEVILAALTSALGDWCEGERFLIDLESHGRREQLGDVDLSRTTGWFTALYPALLECHQDPETALVRVKEHLRGIPDAGVSYGMAAWLGKHFEDQRAEISFNYHGVLDGLKSANSFLTPAREEVVEKRKQNVEHHWPLEIMGSVMDGQLRLFLGYESRRFPKTEMQKLLAALETSLAAFIEFCASSNTSAYTPSDFPLASLTAEQLKQHFPQRQGIQDLYPCTPMQESMLYHCVSNPNSGFYITQYHYGLEGALEPKRFETAWNQVIAKHGILRTGFLWEALDRPVQVVYEQTALQVSVEDWRELTATQRKSNLETLAETWRREGFDLTKAPLMNVNLFQVAEESWLMVWNLHHIILDAWSIPLLLDDLLDAYGGKELKPGHSYGEFMAWMARQDKQQAKAFWSDKLAGFSGPTPLPLANQVGSKDSDLDDQRVKRISLDAETTTGIQDFARTNKLTLNTLCQGVWAILLSRHGEREDVLFGATTSGRPSDLDGVEEIAGLFLNTLPLRARVDHEANPADWLAQLQKDQGAVREYDYCAQSEIRSWSKIAAGSLFDSILVFENAPSSEANKQTNTQEIQLIPKSGSERTNFPLTLIAVLAGDQLLLKMDYQSAYFHDLAIDRLLGEFRFLLEGLVKGASTLGELQHIRPCDRERASNLWQEKKIQSPKGNKITDLFEQQVALRPDAIALSSDGNNLTYQELNQQANQLAHRLRKLGVGPDQVVGLCMQRSNQLMIGILGIIKAGGAYLPLDPNYPTDRLVYMMEDSGASLVVTMSGLGEELGGQRLELDRDASTLAQESELNPEPVGNPDDLAYLIYTSGSTGRPKGALMTHHNVVRLRAATAHWYGFDESDVWPLFHSYAFDVSVWEMWGALLNGGRLVIPSHEQTRSPQDFYRLCADEGITVLNQTPSAFYPLTEVVLQQTSAWTPKWVIFAGEYLDVARLAPWFDHFGDQRTTMVNMYGTTETCVHATYRVVRHEDIGTVTANGVGEPIPDLDLLVLDQNLEPSPMGTAGEIYIGGPGLARGYHNRPELSRERFMESPFEAGQRLYKTGDWGRITFQGELEYLGRRDHQVKIRGFRVELGEIEAALREHDSIETAVVGTDDRGDHLRLVAWYLPTQEVEIEELRSFLAVSLPEYMVPTLWVAIDHLPLTSNGKADRKALPKPDQTTAASGAYVAPSSEVEIALTEIWQDILGLEGLGVYDNFFELGGDSIVSIRIVARAVERGLYLKTQDIFDNPTIAQLATLVRSGRKPEAEQGLITGTAPLLPIQRWFFEKNLQNPHHFNLSRLYQVEERLDQHLLTQTLQHLLSHHDSLRLVFTHNEQGEICQSFQPVPEQMPLIQVDLPQENWEARMDEAALQAQSSFDLQTGPLTKLVWFKGNNSDHLLWIVHHLVSDVVSMNLLVEDFTRIYETLRDRRPIKLPAKTTDLASAARLLQKAANAPETLAEAAYWTRDLDRKTPPFDFPEGKASAGTTRLAHISLSSEETRTLIRELPESWRLAPHDLLLTALALSWKAWTGGDLDMDMEGHGRQELDESHAYHRTMGWFTSLYPLRLQIENKEPLAALKSIKEQIRRLPRHGIGYGLLRYLSEDQELRKQMAKHNAPIRFNYLGVLDGAEYAKGLLKIHSGPRGMEMNPDEHEEYPMRLDGWVRGGRLTMELKYSPEQFKQETVATLVDHLNKNLRQLLDCCRQTSGLTPSDVPLARMPQSELDQLHFDARNIEDIHPLSPLQEGMLFHSLQEPDSGVYVNQAALRFDGSLDPERFRAAWSEVVATHGILRSVVLQRDSQSPLLMTLKHVELPLCIEDIRGLTDTNTHVQKQLADDLGEPFDFANGPLMRLRLLQVGDHSWRFLWTYHHILLDAWSMPLIWNQLFTVYTDLSQGKKSARPRVRPYGDYIRYLSHRDADQAAAWWREHLKGFTTPTPLPLVSARHQQLGEIRKSAISLSAEVTAALVKTARQQKVTLNTLLQGIWGLLLGKYAGMNDVLFGATTAGRPADLPGVEEMAGMFINTQPVRIDLTSGQSVGNWLRTIQRHMNRQRRFEHVSLTDIRKQAQVSADESFFHTILVFENAPAGGAMPNESDLEFQVKFDRGFQKSNFPLALVVVPGTSMTLQLEYGDACYSAETIQALSQRLQHLLTELPKSVGGTLAELPFATAEETQRALIDWNQTEVDYPAETPVHKLFEARVAEEPNRIALKYGDGELTYNGLNRKANQLAGELRNQGVVPGDLVAIGLSRSVDLITSMLAILKCGAAYVPIDSAHPVARNRMILEDARPRVLIGEAQQQEDFSDLVTVITPSYAGDDQNVIVESNHTRAYVIYTSGTTGRPKGVVIHHTAINRLVINSDYLQINRNDRVAQASNTAFDAATFEIWGALLNGAALVGADSDLMLDMQNFGNFLRDQQISILFQTTALFNRMAAENPTGYQSLRCLLFGGQLVQPQWVKEILDRGFTGRLLHVYGPTETTTFATWHEVKNVSEGADNIPIGKPLANTTMYVLSPEGKPVPPGALGEIYLGGPGLAEGYLHRPDLTEERFVANPCKLSERVYRTGDQARISENGSVVFVGRNDHQIKLRGFRIELGEIEAALNQIEGVDTSAVQILERSDGEAYLAAWYCGRVPQTDLRAILAEALPQYMLPTSWTLLEELPLTPNGKVDYRALPNPERTTEVFDQPATPTEKALAQLWSEVLDTEPIGRDDNFFELGGHSLLAARLQTRINALFNVRITIANIFTNGQLAPQAACIDSLPTVAQAAPIQRRARRSKRN